MRFLPPFICFTFFSFPGLVASALVNATVDDRDPSVVYSAPPLQCSDANCAAVGYDAKQLSYQTISMGVSQLNVKFRGSAVYVYLGSHRQTAAQFLIDGELVGSYTAISNKTGGPILGYHNASIPDDGGLQLHTLQVVRQLNLLFDFDCIVYTRDLDLQAPVTGVDAAAPTQTNCIPPPSGEPNPCSQDTKLSAGTVAGSVAAVVGALVGLILVLTIMFYLWVRSRRRTNDDKKTSQDREHTRSSDKLGRAQVTASPSSPSSTSGHTLTSGLDLSEDLASSVNLKRDPSLLEKQIRTLRAQLRLAVQGRSNTLGNSRQPEPGRSPLVTRSFSTLKRPELRIHTVRAERTTEYTASPDSMVRSRMASPAYRTASTASPASVVRTDGGQRWRVTELPPSYGMLRRD
ncbi:hypothetical protein DFH06DRAFT_484202 [Mycena polygramma]|nr:hypothetical protein DFH06DRAFT_484202 [Mycena polygramma]